MTQPYFKHWPKGLPQEASAPRTNLFYNLEVAAARFPDKPALIFLDTPFTYARFLDEAERMAGFLASRGLGKGDRLLIFSQSCPQFAIAYYAALRLGAVIVPVNPMSMGDELPHFIDDSGATMAVCGQELFGRLEPWIRPDGLRAAVVLCYGDYVDPGPEAVPEWIAAPRLPAPHPAAALWVDALAAGLRPPEVKVGFNDLCVLPFTSGTTGKPKGCMHTHGSMLTAIWSLHLWRRVTPETVLLGIAPLSHMLGMQNGLNLPVLLGATVIVMPRWDSELAARTIERYRVSAWTAPPAALFDFFSNPAVAGYDLCSLSLITGGGGAIPEIVSTTLRDRFGLAINEAYGMTETASFLVCNPLDRQKPECLGIPTFGVDLRVIDPETQAELPHGEVGEIVCAGGQLMRGYWNNPAANAEAFVELDGRIYLRTGDLGHADEDGYFYMRDRLKRMINVAGYKVWPAEVEMKLFDHPAVAEACVIGVLDGGKGEAVKALIRLKPDHKEPVAEADIIAWAKARFAPYKVPRIVAFVDDFPRSTTGKILWRELS